jgi:GNAT superfamily N-acetyltransferase
MAFDSGSGSESDLTFTLLPSSDLVAAAELAADAFARSPSYVNICQSPGAPRVAFLTWLFERNFWLRVETTDACRCTYDSTTGQLVAFFMFVKPEVRDPTAWDMISAGLLSFKLLSFGMGTLSRLLQSKSWFEAKEAEVLGDRISSAIRIERMAVRESCQGRGIGSRTLREALKEADALQAPCILTTQVHNYAY